MSKLKARILGVGLMATAMIAMAIWREPVTMPAVLVWCLGMAALLGVLDEKPPEP